MTVDRQVRRRGGLVNVRPEQLAANVRLVDQSFSVELTAVVKGDGYGHGLVTSARSFARGGATVLAVTSVADAQRLRAAGVRTRLLVLDSGDRDLDLDCGSAGLAEAADAALDLVVGEPAVRRLLAAPAAPASGVHVQLEIDAGLGRGAVSPADAAEALSALARRPWITVSGICAQLPSDAPAELVRLVVRDLRRLRSLAPGAALHLGGSDALRHAGELDGIGVRVGRLLYGVRPRWLAGDRLPGLDLGWAWTANAEPYDRPPRFGYGDARASVRGDPIRIDVGYADGLPPAAAGCWPVIAGDSHYVVQDVFMTSCIAYPVSGPPVGAAVGVLLCGRDGPKRIPVRTVSEALGVATSAVLVLPRSPRRVVA